MEQSTIKSSEKHPAPAIQPNVIKKWLRFLPAVVFMSLIFACSAVPANELAKTTRPIMQKAPQSIRVSQESQPIKINWLKVGHFVGYTGLGIAFYFAFLSSTRKPILFAIFACFLYAITDELHQMLVPGRHAWVNDIVLDTLSSTLAVITYQCAIFLFSRAKNKP